MNYLEKRNEVCEINTIVIGAGHAGLCMSFALQEENTEHIILEKKRALEQWRSKRWDSFKMNTPIAYSRIMGQNDGLPDDQMNIPLAQSIKMWEDCIKERNFPIREQTEVISVEQDKNGQFLVKVKSENEGPKVYIAANVIAAPGNYQIPNIPTYSIHLGSDIQQLRVGTYTNPEAIQDGAILVVGSGQTGIQLSEELLKAGRKVFIATSKVPGTIRSYRGEDVFFWLDRTGTLTMPKEALPDSNMKYDRIPFTGNNHPISYYSLARMGATLLGRLSGISEDGTTATFNDNLQENIAVAQGGYDFLINVIEGWIEATGNTGKFPDPVKESEWEAHPPLLENKAPDILNLKENNITTILWATGWNADLSWLKIDDIQEELGPHGRPESCESAVPGFYWLGFHWLRFLNSGNVAGFHHDARDIIAKMKVTA